MRKSAARQTRLVSYSLRHPDAHLIQDMNSIKEELRQKEAIKEAEQKRRGEYLNHSPAAFKPYFQTNSRMRKPVQPSKRRSKLTKRLALKRRLGKRRFAMDSLFQTLPHSALLHPQPLPRPLPASKVKTSKKRVCKYACRQVDNRTRRHCQAMRVSRIYA